MPSARKAYYKILQMDPAAEPEVIKAAQQRLANKYHPDKNKSPDANHRMQEINEAYRVLRDPAKRAEYDRRRSAGPDQNQGEDARERYEAEAARRHDKEAAGAAKRRAEEERRRREGAAAQRRAQEEQEQHADQRRTRTSAVIAVMVVAVVVAFGMLVRTNDDNKPGATSAEPTAPPQVPPPYQIGKEVSPESEVCTISADTKDGITHGTVYFAGDGDKNGDKIRVDRETSLNNIKKPDHILINSDIAYFWSKNKGIKFHHKGVPPKSFFEVFPGLTRLQHGPVKDNWSWRTTSSETTKWSISPLTKFECQKWTPDNSVFVPPINIGFLDATGENNFISYIDNVWGR